MRPRCRLVLRLLLSAWAIVLAEPQSSSAADHSGDAESGRALMSTYGCGACHVIPGVDRAVGRVGPPLGTFATSLYIAGVLPNVSPFLQAWIRQPQQIQPGTGMPDLGVTAGEARDMAAYLYTLRDR